MLDILTGLISGAGMVMPQDDRAIAGRITLSRFELLRASFRILTLLEPITRSYFLHRPKFIILWRLILANHFEKITNDVKHPIAFRKSEAAPV